MNSRFCGIHGNNYEWLENLDIGAIIEFDSYSLNALFKKLSYQRCDFLSYSPIMVKSAINAGQLELPEAIEHVPFPGVEKSNFYYWVSNNSSKKKKIIEAINETVESLQGEKYENYFLRYLELGSERVK